MTDTQAQQTKIYKDLVLNKKKYVIMTGDSIAYRLSLETNFSNYFYRLNANEYLFTTAVSGSNMANFTGGDSATWNPLSVVTRSAVGATNIFDIKNTDLLMVWAGFNDKNDNVPLGAIDSNDPLTYAGAIRNAVVNYQARKPDMEIMFITPNANPYEVNNALGINIIDYRNHMISVCANIGIPCFDLYAVCGITDANKATALPDQIHPSSAFLESWSPLIATFVLDNIF
jgi:hypothetical protein